jgi:hypothetical protein
MGAQQNKQAARDAYAAFGTSQHDFVAEGDKVVVVTTRELRSCATGGGADEPTCNDDARHITVEALGHPTQTDQVFAR